MTDMTILKDPYPTPVEPALEAESATFLELPDDEFDKFVESITSLDRLIEEGDKAEAEALRLANNPEPAFGSEDYIRLRDAIRLTGSDYLGKPSKDVDVEKTHKYMSEFDKRHIDIYEAIELLDKRGALTTDVLCTTIVKLHKWIESDIGGESPDLLSLSSPELPLRRILWQKLGERMGVVIEPFDARRPSEVLYGTYGEGKSSLSDEQKSKLLKAKIILTMDEDVDINWFTLGFKIDDILGLHVRKLSD